MNKTSIVIFYLDSHDCPAVLRIFSENPLGDALSRAEELRNGGNRHVTISTEMAESVGKPGVDVTGADYNWKKRRI